MAQESMRDMTEGQRNRAAVAAQDMAERAGAYAQQQATWLSDRAQGLATDANALVKQYTGRPVETWAADARGYARAHPLQMVLATIGVGYILGKILKR